MPSFTAVLFECGEAASFEPWQLNVEAWPSGSKSKKGEQEGPGARARRQEKAAAKAKKNSQFLAASESNS